MSRRISGSADSTKPSGHAAFRLGPARRPRRRAGVSGRPVARIALLSAIAVLSPPAALLSLGAQADRVESAERFFEGLYGCDATVVRELASPDVVVSYPIFETVVGTPVIRGVDAVEAFARRFCGKWAEPAVVVHERLSDGPLVVLVWSFSARDASAGEGAPRSSWGGISLFTFDGDGRIVAEVGEESSPGPVGRLEKAGAR